MSLGRSGRMMVVRGASAVMPDFDLHEWFAEEELRLCPSCGERAGLRIEATGAFMCFACGLIRTRDGETTVGRLQGKKPEPG